MRSVRVARPPRADCDPKSSTFIDEQRISPQQLCQGYGSCLSLVETFHRQVRELRGVVNLEPNGRFRNPQLHGSRGSGWGNSVRTVAGRGIRWNKRGRRSIWPV
jgi:hypothetical protein